MKRWLAFSGWFLFHWVAINLAVFAAIGMLNLVKSLVSGRISILVSSGLLIFTFIVVNACYLTMSGLKVFRYERQQTPFISRKVTRSAFWKSGLLLTGILLLSILWYLLRRWFE